MENFIIELENKIDELKDVSNVTYMDADFYNRQETKIELLKEIIELANKYK